MLDGGLLGLPWATFDAAGDSGPPQDAEPLHVPGHGHQGPLAPGGVQAGHGHARTAYRQFDDSEQGLDGLLAQSIEGPTPPRGQPMSHLDDRIIRDGGWRIGGEAFEPRQVVALASDGDHQLDAGGLAA